MSNKKKFILGLIVFFSIVTIGIIKYTTDSKAESQNSLLVKMNEDTTEYKYFQRPDKILLINKGNIDKTIEKGTDLYNKILELTNKRFESRLYTLKSIMNSETFKVLENNGLVLEFIYNEPKHTEFYDQFLPAIKQYVRLIMPLSDSNDKDLYIDDGNGSELSPITNLLTAQELVDLLK